MTIHGLLPFQQANNALCGRPYLAPRSIRRWAGVELDTTTVNALADAGFFCDVEVLSLPPGLCTAVVRRMLEACTSLRELHTGPTHEISPFDAIGPVTHPAFERLHYRGSDLEALLHSPVLSRPIELHLSLAHKALDLSPLERPTSPIEALCVDIRDATSDDLAALEGVSSRLIEVRWSDRADGALSRCFGQMRWPALLRLDVRLSHPKSARLCLSSERLPQLRELKVEGFRELELDDNLHELRTLELSARRHTHRLPPQTEVLATRLETLRLDRHLSAQVTPTLLESCTSLQALHLVGIPVDTLMCRALASCHKLVDLAITGGTVHETPLFETLDGSSRIRRLDLAHTEVHKGQRSPTPLPLTSLRLSHTRLPANALPELLCDKLAERLEDLDLDNLDLDGVLNLAEMFPRLKHLSLQPTHTQSTGHLEGLERSLETLCIRPSDPLEGAAFNDALGSWITSTSWPRLVSLQASRANLFVHLEPWLEAQRAPRLNELSCGCSDLDALEKHLRSTHAQHLALLKTGLDVCLDEGGTWPPRRSLM